MGVAGGDQVVRLLTPPRLDRNFGESGGVSRGVTGGDSMTLLPELLRAMCIGDTGGVLFGVSGADPPDVIRQLLEDVSVVRPAL